MLYIAVASGLAVCLCLLAILLIRKNHRKYAMRQGRLSDAFQRSRAEHRYGDAGMSVNILVAGLRSSAEVKQPITGWPSG